MKKQQFIFLLLAIIVSLSPLSLYAQSQYDNNDKFDEYIFPIKPGSEEWKSFTSLKEMTEACMIPKNVLNKISTDGLIVTCMNYPLFLNVLAFDNLQDGFESVLKYFNGLQELQTRQDAGIKLYNIYKEMYPHDISDTWISKQKGEHSFNFLLIELLLAQDLILSKLSKEERIKILKECYNKTKLKEQNPKIFGYICRYITPGLLMCRILLMENYIPLVELISQSNVLQSFIKNGYIIDKESLNEVFFIIEEFILNNN